MGLGCVFLVVVILVLIVLDIVSFRCEICLVVRCFICVGVVVVVSCGIWW